MESTNDYTILILAAPADSVYAGQLGEALQRNSYTVAHVSGVGQLQANDGRAIVILAVLSPAALVDEGWHRALAYARQEGKWVIPCLYGEADFPDLRRSVPTDQWQTETPEAARVKENLDFLAILFPFKASPDSLREKLPGLLHAIQGNWEYAAFHTRLQAKWRQWTADSYDPQRLLSPEDYQRAAAWLALGTHRMPVFSKSMLSYVKLSEPMAAPSRLPDLLTRSPLLFMLMVVVLSGAVLVILFGGEEEAEPAQPQPQTFPQINPYATIQMPYIPGRPGNAPPVVDPLATFQTPYQPVVPGIPGVPNIPGRSPGDSFGPGPRYPPGGPHVPNPGRPPNHRPGVPNIPGR